MCDRNESGSGSALVRKTRPRDLRVTKQYPQVIVTLVKDFTELFHNLFNPQVITRG